MSTSPERALAKKPPKLYSCALCTRRKVKCDRCFPCSYCVKCGVNCTQPNISSSKPRKRRFAESELLGRLKRYETVLKGLGQDLDKINAGVTPAASLTMDVVKASSTADEGESGDEALWQSGRDHIIEESYLRGSDSEDMDKAPITSTWNAMYHDNGSSLLFGPGSQDVDLVSLHPPPELVFGLWQTFIDCVNPLIKIIHYPTTQPQILNATFKLHSAEPALHALMFGIYSMAVDSQDEQTCLNIYGQDKAALLNRFHLGSQCALRQAQFLRSSDFMVLQALVLHLSSVRIQVDPRSLFCFTGMAERIARRNGFHRAGRIKGLSMFENEMRKRLWWQIVVLEMRMAEMSGAGPSMVSFHWDANLPLNVNDSDLDPGMNLEPRELAASTEMLFCLPRYEVAEYLRQVRLQNGLNVGFHEFSTPKVVFTDAKRSIDELEQRIHDKYLKYCDPQFPLHAMAITGANFAINKIRYNLRSAGFIWGIWNKDCSLPEHEKDYLFELSVSMLEDHNKMRALPGLRKFDWFINFNVPMVQCIQVAFNLRFRPTGALSDRAWEAVSISMNDFEGKSTAYHSRRNLLDSPLHLAVANLLVKAWETREQALRREAPMSTPDFISKMKLRLATKKNAGAHVENTAFPSNSSDGLDNADGSFSTDDLGRFAPLSGLGPLWVPGQEDPPVNTDPAEFWSSFIPAEMMMQNLSWSQMDGFATQ